MVKPHKYYMEICILFMQIYVLEILKVIICYFLIKIDIYGCCMYDLLDEEDKEC